MNEAQLNKLWASAREQQQLGNFSAAELLYRQMLEIMPGNKSLLHELGHVCFLQDKTLQAIEFLAQACVAAPDDPLLHFNLAAVQATAGHYTEAIAHYRQTVALDGDHEHAWLNMGVIHYELHDYTAAIDCLHQVTNINNNNTKAHYNLGLALLRTGRSEEAVSQLRRALQTEPGNPVIHSCLLYALQNIQGLGREEIFNEHLEWERRHAASLLDEAEPCKQARNNALPIRVGYVSPDFRAHSVACFISPLLRAHNRNVVTSYCYANVLKPDAVTARLMQLADNWRDIATLSDEQVVAQIRQDKIDILVDLSGHTDRNRLLVFARKPSRIQVSYLGYPDTTGLHAIDYRITDRHADPETVSDHLHTEKLARLETGFLCYEPPPDAPDTGSAPVSRNGYITFGSFNNLSKMNAQLISVWSRILQALPEARLLLKASGLGDDAGKSVIHAGFRAHGIAGERIECVGHIGSTANHLALYRQVDIALDTFPYNGTTTSCEALWMGVPVITLSGNRHTSRVGTSLLRTTGLSTYIADSEADYINLAIQLATDPATVIHLRQTLRQKIRTSPLLDRDSFTRCLERHYLDMLAL